MIMEFRAHSPGSSSLGEGCLVLVSSIQQVTPFHRHPFSTPNLLTLWFEGLTKARDTDKFFLLYPRNSLC